MAILTPVIKLVVFRQSLRPHSAIAFLVEFLCFVLELLDKEKDLAKIFGIVCACDTLIFTLLDLIQNMVEEEVKIQRCGQVFWLYTKDGSLYWHTLNAYLLMLCIVHVIGSALSYVSHTHYLVLLPLFVAGLELVPQEAYRVLGPNQEAPNCNGPLQSHQDYIGSDQENQDYIGPLEGHQDNVGSDQETRDCTGPLQGHQDYAGLEQESRDCIGPLHDPLDGKYQNFQDDGGQDLESQHRIAVLEVPVDGSELEQKMVVHVDPLQEPLDGVELDQEVVVHVGLNEGP